jgi:hypothetical protein
MKTPKILVVTSFGEKGYNQYGQRFLETFKANWPSLGKKVHLNVYHHSQYPSKEGTLWTPNFKEEKGISFFNLDDSEETFKLKDVFFKLFLQKFPTTEGFVPWQLDVPKFVNKVFALGHANANYFWDYDWIIWLDADTQTLSPIPLNFLTEELLDDKADVIRLGRTAVNYSETSFVAFKTSQLSKALIDKLLATYNYHEYMNYTEWHDGFIFERLLNTSCVVDGLSAKNISLGVEGLDAFSYSVLSNYMEHNKGNKKANGGAAETATGLPQGTMQRVKEGDNRNNPYGNGQGPVKAHPFSEPLIVNAVDSAPSQALKENIITNISLIKNWVKECKKVAGSEVIVASAGPSLDQNYDRIKQRVSEGAKVMCVKHSYPKLLANGIIPDYCVALDPRDIEGTSTTGFVRKNLYEAASPEPSKTVFLIATMTHPSVTEHLLKAGKKVFGWHAYSGELMEVYKEKPELFPCDFSTITTGTCSAIRGIGLMDLLGFEKFTLVGFDSSVEEPTEGENEEVQKNGLKKRFKVWLPPGLDFKIQIPRVEGVVEGYTPIGGRFFWSTGEFIALYQDLVGCLPLFLHNAEKDRRSIEVWFDTDTLVGEGWRRLSTQKSIAEKLYKSNSEKRSKQPSVDELLGVVV